MTIYVNLARHQQLTAAYNALFSSFSTRVDSWRRASIIYIVISSTIIY